MGVRLSALVATILLGLVGGLTSPAYAEKHVAMDAAGDVVTIDEVTDDTAPVPENTDSDIVKTVINHRRHQVVVKVKLRDLTGPRSGEFREVLAFIKTNKGNKGNKSVIVAKLGAGKPRLIIEGSQREIKCRAASRTYSAATDRITMSIPRRCLGNPRWIKVGVMALSGSFETENQIFLDDGLRSTFSLYGSPRTSPKLKRG